MHLGDLLGMDTAQHVNNIIEVTASPPCQKGIEAADGVAGAAGERVDWEAKSEPQQAAKLAHRSSSTHAGQQQTGRGSNCDASGSAAPAGQGRISASRLGIMGWLASGCCTARAYALSTKAVTSRYQRRCSQLTASVKQCDVPRSMPCWDMLSTLVHGVS